MLVARVHDDGAVQRVDDRVDRALVFGREHDLRAGGAAFTLQQFLRLGGGGAAGVRNRTKVRRSRSGGWLVVVRARVGVARVEDGDAP